MVTNEFLRVSPQSAKHYKIVEELHGFLEQSITDRPKAHHPVSGELDANTLTSRLKGMGALVGKVQSLDFQE